MTLLAFMALFPEFQGASWDAWRDILARVGSDVREFFAIVGRGAGKSRIVALLATYFGVREYPRASGESIYIGIFAPDRKQSAVTFRYVLGLLKSVPELASLIANETRDSVELSNGVIIEVITASIAAPRGRAYALVIIEEAAFLPSDTSANPDVELLRAVRPALARVPGSLLAVVSSPYARRGVIYTATLRKADPAVLVVQASTLDLNPLFDASAVARAYEEDPASAAAEYGGLFRSDVESFISREPLEASVVEGRHGLPPVPGEHVGFTDPAGGSGKDAFSVCVARRLDSGIVQVVALREARPPFSPEVVTAEFCELLKTYGVHRVTGDRYAGEWPREQFRKHGVAYDTAEKSKSDLYRDLLPMLMSGQVELLDDPRLLAQLGALERRTGRGGRDIIDHPPGVNSHDDLANAVAGACVVAGVLNGRSGGCVAVAAGEW